MDTQSLISVLTWSVVAMGGALVTSLLWFARRSVSQLDRLQRVIGRLILRIAILESKAGIRHSEPDPDAADD